MLRRKLKQGELLLMVENRPTRMGAAIHMFAVFTALGVLWIDASQRVIDARLARPWRVYLPKAAAQYVLEGDPSLLEQFDPGDQLAIERSHG